MAVMAIAPSWSVMGAAGPAVASEPARVSVSPAASPPVGEMPWTALWDSEANRAILTATNVRPGFASPPAQGQVIIANLAAPAMVRLQETSIVFTCPASTTYPKRPPSQPASGTGCTTRSPGYGQGNLSAELRLTVTDSTTGRLVFGGLFNATGGAAPGPSSLATQVQVCGLNVTRKQPCPAWAEGEHHTFSFRVTFPNTAGAAGRDNVYQGTRASAAFVWETA
jgi:hypothetical protein